MYFIPKRFFYGSHPLDTPSAISDPTLYPKELCALGRRVDRTDVRENEASKWCANISSRWVLLSVMLRRLCAQLDSCAHSRIFLLIQTNFRVDLQVRHACQGDKIEILTFRHDRDVLSVGKARPTSPSCQSKWSYGLFCPPYYIHGQHVGEHIKTVEQTSCNLHVECKPPMCDD